MDEELGPEVRLSFLLNASTLTDFLMSSVDEELWPVARPSFLFAPSTLTDLSDSLGTLRGAPPPGYSSAKHCTAAAVTRCERGAGE